MGHLYGDTILKQVATALQEQTRLQDLLVRMGGDVLLLALADTDLQAAGILCERLCRVVNKLDIKAGSGKLGISIGLAQWQQGMSKKEKAKSKKGSSLCLTLFVKSLDCRHFCICPRLKTTNVRRRNGSKHISYLLTRY